VKWLRRRKFVIDWRLQLSFLLITLGYLAFMILVISVSLFAPLILQLRHVNATSAEASDLALKILYLHDKFWLPVFLALVAISLDSLRTTHKIAGPLHRFRQVFEALSEGRLPKPVKLRKGDRLSAEMEAINRMLAALREQIGQMQTGAEKLHETISRYCKLPKAAAADPATHSLWNDVLNRERQLREMMDRCKIED
jgi:methyl-accepting chemotaxis protein